MKNYRAGFYFLIFSLVIITLVRIKVDFYNSLSFLTQAVILFVLLEILENYEKEVKEK